MRLECSEQIAIRIGEHIRVAIISGRGRTVRLRIRSPRNIAVHREEVFSRFGSQSHVTPSGFGTLFLSRRVGEAVRIGQHIKLLVTRDAVGQMALDVSAPDGMQVTQTGPADHAASALS